MKPPSQFMTVVLFVLTALVVPAATNIASDALPERAQRYVWLAWPIAVSAAVTAAVLELRRRRAAAAQAPSGSHGAEELRHAAEELAQAVHRQWNAEAQIRMLHRPEPLRLRWSTTGRPVAARPAAVLGEDVVGGRPIRLRLRGGSDDIAQKYAQLPKRQLVVLGAPGAGKTVLAILLTLGLLEHRQTHGGPVPVLLSLSSWDPRAEQLDTWVARRLIEDYPALANSGVFGVRAAPRLVTGGHIVPVLDGLDEIPAGLHTAAVDALDHLAPGRPLVITCRSEEYETAVAQGGVVLTTAAVVELEPVAGPEAIAFLSAGGASAESRWAPVLAHLRTCPEEPLARTLSTPLMVTLARAVHTAPSTDPAELLDSDRFPDQAALKGHLLDAFVPAAYTHRPPLPDNQPGKALPSYPPEAAHRWLSFLAAATQRHATRDLAWWQLHQIFPAAGRRGVAVVLELLTGAVAGIGVALGLGSGIGLVAGLAGGLGAGLLATAPCHPGYANIRVRGRLRLLGRKLLLGVMIGVMMGAGAASAFGLAVGLGIPMGGGMQAAAKVAGTVGLSAGLAFAAMMWLNTPADTLRSPSTQASLRDDRLVSAMRLVVESLSAGLLAGFATGERGFGLDVGFTWALTAGLGGGLALGVTGRLTGRFQSGLAASPWGWYQLSRTWLALRGALPWRLMRFLDDAHRRGVLRQAGAVYQFRHASLHDRLAASGTVDSDPGRGRPSS